jgi:hypothetical protein
MFQNYGKDTEKYPKKPQKIDSPSRVGESVRRSRPTLSLILKYPCKTRAVTEQGLRPFFVHRKHSLAETAMPLIRIIASDFVPDELHREALRENRAVSAMGQILLRESLDLRREKRTNTEGVRRLAELLKTPSEPDAAS